MKIPKKLGPFLILTFLFQWMIFSLLDWKADQFLNPYFRFDQAYAVNADISGAYDYSLSYNNKYLALMSDHGLQIIDLILNKPIRIQENSSEDSAVRTMAYRWLPDRNNLLYFVRDHQFVALYSLNLDTESMSDTELVYEGKMERTINYPIQKILEIEISTYTNNLYLLYQDHEPENKLARMDIMKNFNRMDDPGEEVTAMCVSNKFGHVFLETKTEATKAIIVKRDRDRTMLTDDGLDVLLGCRDDAVFVGKTVDNTLKEVWIYQQESGSMEFDQRRIWEGSIPYQPLEVQVNADQQIMMHTAKGLELIQSDSKYDFHAFHNSIVLSDTGKMVMEIIPKNNRFIYFWRAV